MSDTKIEQFNTSAFLKIGLASYFFPFISSVLPGYFFDQPELMQASYSTIAIPSLLATLLCFVLLWQFQKRNILALNKFVMTFFLCLLVVLLSLFTIYIFQLQAATWNIVVSALIGTVITGMIKS